MNKQEIYLVYSTDAWHSHSSKELIGVCSTMDNCIRLIKSDIKKYEFEKLDDDDERMLKHWKQTQGRNINYHIDVEVVDDESIITDIEQVAEGKDGVMLVSQIEWDTDGFDDAELPTEVEVPLYLDEYEIADWLSDEYGFCVKSFSL